MIKGYTERGGKAGLPGNRNPTPNTPGPVHRLSSFHVYEYETGIRCDVRFAYLYINAPGSLIARMNAY